MEMRRVFCVLTAMLLASLLLCSCSGNVDRNGKIAIYRAVAEEYQTSGELFRAEYVDEGEDKLQSAVNALAEAPSDHELESTFDETVYIISHSLSDGELTLNMSAGYAGLSGFKKVMTDYSMALTFCAIDGVSCVTMYVGDEKITDSLTSDMALITDTEANPYEKQVKLYFTDSGGRYLDTEYHTLSVDGDTALERYVLEELLRGPSGGKLTSNIPSGTELVGVSTENSVCTVEFSDAFISAKPESSLQCRLAVYSVVNTLSSLSNVEAVIIKAAGGEISDYGGVSLKNPLAKNENVILRASSNEKDVTLYLATSDGKLAPVPTVLDTQIDGSTAYRAAYMLINSSGEETAYESIFPNFEVNFSADVRGFVCIIDLPHKFFDYYTDMGTLRLAVESIAATLTEFSDINYISVQCNGAAPGYTDSFFDGYIKRSDSLILE